MIVLVPLPDGVARLKTLAKTGTAPVESQDSKQIDTGVEAPCRRRPVVR